MSNIPTPHISSKISDIADTVLMPGDPLRAKFIADNYLLDYKCINNIRNMLGYTGKYKGKSISIIPSGMGMPSMGIYSFELFNFYNVSNIIRIGSAGALSDDLKIKDIVVALGACYDSNYSHQFNLNGTFAPVCSYYLLKKVTEIAKDIEIKINVGNILSSDVFYNENKLELSKWKDMGIMAVEMETAALYMNAAKAHKNALCICTISDNVFSSESCSAYERQTSFTSMMELALILASSL